MVELTKDFFEDGFSFRIKAIAQENSASFEIYEIDSLGSNDRADIVGYVKWDGCMNWKAEQYYHCCSPECAEQLAFKLKRVWEVCGPLIPTKDKYYGV